MPYYYDFAFHKRNILTHCLTRIERAIYTPLTTLKVDAWVTPEPVPYESRMSGEYKSLVEGESWGKLWDCAWMRFTGQVSEQARGHKVVLLIDVSGEGCVVDEQGTPLLGLTTINSEFDKSLGAPGKRVVDMFPSANGGETIDLWVETGANDLFGRLPDNGVLKQAEIATCNDTMKALFYDFFVLNELIDQLPEGSARKARILAALVNASHALTDYTAQEAAEARRILAPELAKTGGTPSLYISAVGHAHIDLGWLWPIRETIRKGGRTFATVLAMMDRYPDYVFGASQAQLYQWMKDRYPVLYEKVKRKIAEGRWEVQGGLWVEADANLSGGEALVRQLLYGKRFFRSEFGKDMKILWLPDTFGYNAALPQLMKKSGVDYFMTIKVTWNKFNVFPHNTFVWQGIDGSRILAHIPPEGNYNSSAAPRAVAATERGYQDKYVSDCALLLFGIGDGGGGPGEEHLERLARQKNLDGLAPVVQEPADAFFRRLDQDRDQYKVWAGELYLEYHQGTLTSQGRNKRFNRKMEIALRELEWSAVLASRSGGYAYPAQALEAIWKEMLLYQFHDILPGSSITRVYDESLARYQALMDQTQQLLGQADAAFVKQIKTTGIKTPVIVMNSLSWDRESWMQIDGTWLKVKAPAMGHSALELAPSSVESSALRAEPRRLENDILRVEFDADGAIQSIVDKASQREVLAGKANALSLYDDLNDAWDFNFDYAERTPRRFELLKSEARIDGPQAVLEQVYHFGQSAFTQKIILTLGSRRLDFVTEVDWKETGKMLRTSFPLAVRSAEVTCNIQYGSINRPTQPNTSWEMAKTEIVGHKWIDLSQRDYGVALLNDCKYGHHVSENVLDLNLLRSPIHPDPVADHGLHQFTYALYPHAGDHVQGQVNRAGYDLNIPLRAVTTDVHDGSLPAVNSIMQVDAANVMIEAVKKAEDSASTILRLYETDGVGGTAHLRFANRPRSIALVNLIEDPQESSVFSVDQEGGVAIPFGPFEIISLKVDW